MVDSETNSLPYRLIHRELETVIESASTGRSIAWFPDALFGISTHPSGRKWAAAYSNHLIILELVGDVAGAQRED